MLIIESVLGLGHIVVLAISGEVSSLIRGPSTAYMASWWELLPLNTVAVSIDTLRFW